jgi:hypothetical protein
MAEEEQDNEEAVVVRGGVDLVFVRLLESPVLG